MENNRHILSISELEKAFSTDLSDGISIREARLRLENEKKSDGGERASLFVPQKSNYLKLAFSFFATPAIVILIVISLLAAVFGNTLTGISVFAVTVIGAVVAGLISQGSQRKLDAMRDFASPQLRIIRGGNRFFTDGRNAVVGDIILLSRGDVLPCDARLISSEGLLVKELINTKSGIRNRTVGKDHSIVYSSEDGIKSPDAVNMLYAGSVILEGEARALVVSTGKGVYLSKFIQDGTLAGKDDIDGQAEKFKPIVYRISFICLSSLAILSLLSLITLRETSFVSNFLMLTASVALLSLELIKMGQKMIFSSTVERLSRSGASKKKKDTTAYIRTSSAPELLSRVSTLALLGRAALYDGVSHVGDICVSGNGDIIPALDPRNGIGNRILTCMHTYLKAIRESGARSALVLDGIADSLTDHIKNVGFDIGGASLVLRSLYFADDPSGENGYACAETAESEYRVALTFDETILSFCKSARSKNGRDTEAFSDSRYTDFIGDVRQRGGRCLFVVSETRGEAVLEGIVSLYEHPSENLSSALPELQKMGVKTLVLLSSEDESVIGEELFASLFGGKVAYASEFRRGRLEITDNIGDFCAYAGFGTDEYALLISALRKRGECVAAYGIDNSYYDAMARADLSVSCDILRYSSAKYKESVYERLAPEGRDTNVRCSQRTRLLSKLIIHRDHARGGGLLSLSFAIRRSRAAFISFAYSVLFFAVIMSALIPLSAWSALLGINLINAALAVCLGVVGAILSMTVFSDAQPKLDLLYSKKDHSAYPLSLIDGKLLYLIFRTSAVTLFAVILKILDAVGIFGETPSYTMPIFISVLLTSAGELLIMNRDFTRGGEGRRRSWIRFLIAYAVVLSFVGIITQELFAAELFPDGLGTWEFLIIPAYCLIYFIAVFAARLVERKRKNQ